MFPNNYSFNPGMVLDPHTMTPMISGSGNITVNPLGVPTRPENKVWQKMFISNMPQECSNENMLKLLNQFGQVKNFKRMADTRGRLMTFCHFELQTGQEIMRIKRLFSNIRILDRQIELKISEQTENFLKQWTSIQKDQWRKKLAAPNMNEAKQYQTIEHYFMRDDRKIKNKIQETLRVINTQVRQIYKEKIREQQRKQHHRQKQRDRKKRRILEDMDRAFNQKEDYWLKRQRDRERQNKKDRQRERQRQKATKRRLQKQINMDPEEEQRRTQKYTTSERRKLMDIEEQQDLEILLQENPPLPEEMPEQGKNGKKTIAYTSEQMKLAGQNKVQDQVLVKMPEKSAQEKLLQRNGQKVHKTNEIFKDWDKVEEDNIPEHQKMKKVELNLPSVQQDDGQANKQSQQAIKKKIQALEAQVPQNKADLWKFPLDWDKLSKTVVLQQNIRPWLQKRSDQYIGGVQEKFIALVEKKLFSRSHPDKIIKVLKQLLDDDSEEFVVRLWKKLILEFLKLQNGIVQQ